MVTSFHLHSHWPTYSSLVGAIEYGDLAAWFMLRLVMQDFLPDDKTSGFTRIFDRKEKCHSLRMNVL